MLLNFVQRNKTKILKIQYNGWINCQKFCKIYSTKKIRYVYFSMTRVLVVSALFLGYAAICRVAANVVAKPHATDKPQLQIIYNPKLREAMKRFQITEADMNDMLTNYLESGKSPTITKSILNPETNLQEVKNKKGLYKESF